MYSTIRAAFIALECGAHFNGGTYLMGALIRIGALINKHQIGGGGGQLLDRRALNRIIKANRRQAKKSLF